MWPANSALFINFYVWPVPLKQLKIAWQKPILLVVGGPQGNASESGARGPGFNSWLWKGFLCLILCFVVVEVLLFCSKHIICHTFCISFCSVNSFSILKTYSKIIDKHLLWNRYKVKMVSCLFPEGYPFFSLKEIGIFKTFLSETIRYRNVVYKV